MRYKDQFSYRFEVDESCLDYLCNKITLQPIIENAIYHGINGLVDEGEIVIRIESQGDDILATVEDNGVGMEKEQIDAIFRRSDSKSGIGIKNVNDRLKKSGSAGAYGITIESVPDEEQRHRAHAEAEGVSDEKTNTAACSRAPVGRVSDRVRRTDGFRRAV